MVIVMKKMIAICLVLVMLVGLFAACSGDDTPPAAPPANDAGTPAPQPPSGGTGEVVTLRLWRAAADENRNAWWEETLARFEAEHPGIRVEFLGVPGNPADFNQRLDMAVAANDAPDIISTIVETSFIARGLLEPIDEQFAAWENNHLMNERYLDIHRALDFTNSPQRLFAIPHGGSVEIMYVRPDLLAAGGFDAPPQTWDEFFEMAEATTDFAQGIYGYIIRGGGGSAMALAIQMYSYSGITDFFIDGVSTINDPLNIEFAERFFGGFGRYTAEDDITKGWPEMAAQFQAGHAAMMIHNLGSAGANYAAFGDDTDVVLAIPYPVSVTGRRLLPAPRATGNMMMASSEHKEEAWILMQWLAEVEQDSGFHELMGNLPLNSEALQASWIQDVSFMRTGAEMMSDPLTDLIAFPHHLPNFGTIITTFVEPNIQNVLLGNMTVEELLNTWAEMLQEDYDALMG